MTTQYSKCGNYMLNNNSLFQLQGASWMHVAIVPVNCQRRIKKAVDWHLNS